MWKTLKIVEDPIHPRLDNMTEKPVIGPTLPPGLKKDDLVSLAMPSVEDSYGPPLPPSMLSSQADSHDKGISVAENRMSEDSSPDSGSDDEVIGPLPSDASKSGLDQAREGVERRAFHMHQKLTCEEGGKKKTKHDKKYFEEKRAAIRDAKLEELIEKHGKKKKKKKSLMEMHEESLKKKKKKDKNGKEKKPERREFDRDVDLKISKMDEAARRSFVKKSQELNSRFGGGSQKYL
ncbi:unnamed protein product [Darwinula stevensoni]|uniref:DUF3752 domain-containing protein n=1 Tax=Darwinula stevensoni TaxID=69355 RepID=A0A7R8XF49_9CRUS|nr:unnamed protein product [Darwinula stevensoni]CAG0890339.1 unnamed protein product [Darwinula stevensoni]